MIYRTYFSKDTTIIKNSRLNTGINPILKLLYGGSQPMFSRILFSFDVEGIKQRMADNTITKQGLKHTLRLTNTISYDLDNMGYPVAVRSEQASSFDLILFKIDEDWDEGIGYDYLFSDNLGDSNPTISYDGANFYNRTTLSAWSTNGVINNKNIPQDKIVSTLHFDLGAENLECDITDLVNDLVENGTGNFKGLGLMFSPVLEDKITETVKLLEFFGKDTHTYFEPHVETFWQEEIKDDRSNFYFDNPNKLYLYTNVKKTPHNLDELPTSVIIKDENEDVVLTLTAELIKHESKGVYSVSFELPSELYGEYDLINFTDTWTGLKMNGRTLKDVEMTFTLKLDDVFNIGNDVYEPQDFTFNFSGIKRGEKIPDNEIRKIVIIARELYNQDELIVDGIFFNLYVKQGNNRIMIIENTPVNRAFNQNFFYFDTSWLIVQDYWMDIIVHSNGVVTKKQDIHFSIVDSKLTQAINNI